MRRSEGGVGGTRRDEGPGKPLYSKTWRRRQGEEPEEGEEEEEEEEVEEGDVEVEEGVQ